MVQCREDANSRVSRSAHGVAMTPSKGKRSKADPDDRSWSSTKTCVALAIAWAVIVWGLAANAYHVFEARSQNVPVVGGRRIGLGRLIGVFVYQSVAQLPNAMQVISHAVAEKKWIPVRAGGGGSWRADPLVCAHSLGTSHGG